MTSKHSFWIPIYCLIAFSVIGQPKIDSLRSAIKNPPVDTSDVKTMVLLSMGLFYTGSFDTALHHAIQARKLAEKLSYKKGIGNALLASGYAYRLKGAYQPSVNDFNEALMIFRELKNNVNIGRSLNFLAQTYQSLGEQDKALECLLQAQEFVEKAGHKEGLSVIFIDIGNNYSDRGNYEAAIDYYLKSLRLSESIPAYSKMAIALNNIGTVYEKLEQIDKALEFYERSITICREKNIQSKLVSGLNNAAALYVTKTEMHDKADQYLQELIAIVRKNGDREYEVNALANLGALRARQQDIPQAEKYFKHAIDIGREINHPESIVGPLAELGEIAIKQGKYDRATKYGDEAIQTAIRSGNKWKLKDMYFYHSRLDSARGNFKSAYGWFKKYALLKDSLTNEKKSAQIVYLQKLYDQERKLHQDNNHVELNEHGDGSKFSTSFIILISLCTILFISTLVLLFLLWKKSREVTHAEAINS